MKTGPLALVALTAALPASARPQDVPAAPVAASAACDGGVLTGTAATAAEVRAAGLAILSPDALVAATRLRSTCRGKVARVSHGAVVLDTGEFFDVGGGHVVGMGLGQARVPTTPCVEVPDAAQCVRIAGRSGSVLALRQNGGGQRVELVDGSSRSVVLRARAGARLVGIAYLPAPDAPGGILTAYVSSGRVGYLILLNTKV